MLGILMMLPWRFTHASKRVASSEAGQGVDSKGRKRDEQEVKAWVEVVWLDSQLLTRF